MLFSSTAFIYVFLPVVLFIYYVILRNKRSSQNIFLFTSSLVFYSWGEPGFVFLMMLSILVNWLMGLLIDKNRELHKFTRTLLIIDVCFNLGLLFIFKYLMFSGELINSIFRGNLYIPRITLPIGISFFTFQALSYVIDVYRGRGEVQTNLLYVGLYISFFPQLIAGPIVRYETVAYEIKNRRETVDDFFDGFVRFVIGLSKKVLLANHFAVLADQSFDIVHSGASISVLMGWLGALAYTFQIFYDFSGYSDMAIGLGRMFGFHFLENFNYPYVSTSITEFWRRWHISLGTWFRDYLYIPMGGNRCGEARNALNLFVVWLLTGLWHGANITFAMWGLMYFFLLLLERKAGLVKWDGKVINVLKWVYTFFFVVIGWVIFRAESIGDALVYIQSLFGIHENRIVDGAFVGWCSQNFIPLLIGAILCTPIVQIVSEKFRDNTIVKVTETIVLCGLFVFSISGLVSSSYNPFIYFNF